MLFEVTVLEIAMKFLGRISVSSVYQTGMKILNESTKKAQKKE